MSLFTIDDETRLVRLDKDSHIFLIKEFSELLKRVIPVNGDSDGRKKLGNLKELAYVWYVCDTTSYVVKNGLSDKDALVELRKSLELGKDWSPDDKVKAAIHKYREINETLPTRIFKSLSRSFNNSDKVINKLNDQLDQALDNCDVDYRNADEEAVEKLRDNIKQLLYLQKEVMNLANDLPGKIKSLKDAERAMSEEKETKEKLRGGDEIPDSANPDSDE